MDRRKLKTKRQIYESNMKINDIVAMIFGLVGLGLAFWEHELFYGEIEFDKSGSGEWGTEEERT